MHQLNLNEIDLVSGGSKTNYDAVDIASTLTGAQLFCSSVSYALVLYAGLKPYSSMYTIPPTAIAYAFGAYVGYHVGQYIKGDE